MLVTAVLVAAMLVTAALHAKGFWERVGFELRPGNKITQVERELTEQKMLTALKQLHAVLIHLMTTV